MKLTKKFIKENSGMTLKEAFPDVFETPFTGWMISDINGWIGYFEDNRLQYGISSSKTWFISERKLALKVVNCDRPATNEEVLEALSNEAVKRGFKEGCTGNNSEVRGMKFNNNLLEKGFFELKDNVLHWSLGDIKETTWDIFRDGIWATIIKPKQMTIQEIEKEFNIQVV